MSKEFALEITPTPKYLANKLKLSMPYSYDEIHTELLNEPWTLPVVNVWQHRYKSYHPVSPMLQELALFLSSDETKRRIIKAIYEGSNGLFPTRWGMSEEELFKVTSLHAEFTKDAPGFVQNIHLDYKLLVATGMIFFSPKDDPAISTVYYETPDGEGAMRMESGWCDGWMHANDYSTWHGGGNAADYDRYSVLIGLTLNIKPLDKYLTEDTV